MKTCFATIVSANYLAYAKVLGQSLSQQAPDASFKVLVVDRKSNEVLAAAAASELDITFAEDLRLPEQESIFYKYDILELNTGLKPSFIKHIFKAGFTKVIYSDPDTFYFSPPAPMLDALDQNQVVLTPHTVAPLMDGLRPSEIDFLRSGVFNLGFVGFATGEQTRTILDWWEQRCLAYGYNDLTQGTFVDQKWMDLLPAYCSSLGIIKHPGCNAAYWNLHERSLEKRDGHYTANGLPLIFFHFSGVRPGDKSILSKYSNRYTLVAGSVLAGMVSDYCDSLTQAGHQSLEGIAYTFGKLTDGTLISRTMRRALESFDTPVLLPFDADSSFQKNLRTAGIYRQGKASVKGISGITTLNINQTGKRLSIVNMFIKIATKFLGTERLWNVLQYSQFLMRGSNYPSLLLNEEFKTEHGRAGIKKALRSKMANSSQ